MLAFKVNVKGKYVIANYANKIALSIRDFVVHLKSLLLINLRKTITTYMRHTVQHGWNYRYTGKLKNSFSGRIRKIKYGYRLRVYPKAPYDKVARLLEFGGEVRPRVKKFLRIPLKHTPIPFNDVRVNQLKARNGILYYNNIPMFVLKLSVKHPPYFFMHRALMKTKYQVPKLYHNVFVSRVGR